MAETSINLQGDGHPYCEKLVWQGEFEGVQVRVRIVQESADSPIETVVERYALAADKVDRWIHQDGWEKPERSHPWSLFVEGFIDLCGRPEWDTRAKVASSYPLGLAVGREW